MQNQNFCGTYKSYAAAILLGLFLGPIGLLYGSFRVSVVATALCLFALIVPMGGIAILFFWPLCAYINVFLVGRYYRKLILSAKNPAEKVDLGVQK